MHNKDFIIKLFSLLVFITFLASCSSTTYIENDKSNSANIDLKELNKSSQNVIDRFAGTIGSNTKKKIFLLELSKYIGTPYRYGGESIKGMDCSGLTQTVYRNSLNVKLPRTAREQFKTGEKIGSRRELKFGDLMFFDTSDIHFPGHVGIFLDNDLFVHASSSKGVIISSLNNSYYANKYIGATRIKVKRKKNKIKR